jgi:hypothetical protein
MGKIYARLILWLIRPALDESAKENQGGFPPLTFQPKPINAETNLLDGDVDSAVIVIAGANRQFMEYVQNQDAPLVPKVHHI